MTWDEALSSYDELVAEHHHVDMYWFPHTDRMMTKTNDRLADLDAAEPLPRWRGWLDDELLSNTVFGALTTVATRAPRATPLINRVSARALSERRYSDIAHRVFTTPRRVRFKEMEYAVPREVGLDVLREVRREVDASDWRSSFPVEIRTAPADDITLSTASGRDSLYLAFHVPVGADHRAYFAGIEAVLATADGRPHWGKMHTRDAADLARRLPAVGRVPRSCATGSTRTGSSPTPTSTACWADRRRCSDVGGTVRERRPPVAGPSPAAGAPGTRRPRRSTTTPRGRLVASSPTATAAPSSAGVAYRLLLKTTGGRPASTSRTIPPPMPVTIPISAAGIGPRPYSRALSAPVTQKSDSPNASKTSITRSIRPTVGWKTKVSSPATSGTLR